MATVVNNPSSTLERTIERDGDSSAGWAVAVVILLAILAIGGFLLMRYWSVAPAATPTDSNGGTNINVTLPESPAANPGIGGGAAEPTPTP